MTSSDTVQIERYADWFRDVVRMVGSRYHPVSEVEVDPIFGARFTFVEDGVTYRVTVESREGRV